MIPVSHFFYIILLKIFVNRSFLIARAVANFLQPPPGFGDWFWNHFLDQSKRLSISHKKLGTLLPMVLCFYSLQLLNRAPTGFHNGGPEHFGHLLCDDWARSFSNTSILFVESNQYFAAALRHNQHHVCTIPAVATRANFLYISTH
jgi:hypothetical protein